MLKPLMYKEGLRAIEVRGASRKHHKEEDGQ